MICQPVIDYLLHDVDCGRNCYFQFMINPNVQSDPNGWDGASRPTLGLGTFRVAVPVG